eukprot:5699269-Prymnesium_polylepis.1
MQLALQVAVQNRHVDIIKLLLSQTGQLITQLDFFSLYRTELRLFRESNKLSSALVDGEALKTDGMPTPPLIFAAVMSPFLEQYVPGMTQRLDKFRTAGGELSFHDLIFWA